MAVLDFVMRGSSTTLRTFIRVGTALAHESQELRGGVDGLEVRRGIERDDTYVHGAAYIGGGGDGVFFGGTSTQ